MRSLLQDLRYGLRQLIKGPGFTITAVLSLACGIAATTAVFSVVWGIIVNPYPYAAPDRMVHFALGFSGDGNYNGFGVTADQWRQLRQLPAIEDSILTGFKNLTITGGDLPEDVQVGEMTSNAFNFFGVPTLLGRGLIPSDAPDGKDPQPVVVLGYKFWQRRFQGDPAIVGKTVQLTHQTYTVVGVAPQRFTWGDSDVYLPMKTVAGNEGYQMETRLKPGVSHHMAEQQLQPLIKQFEKETPTHYPPKPGPLNVIGLNDQFLAQIGPSLALLFGAVLLLLAIGCGNVSILLLARGTAREHEFAVRAAIGATRSRIVRQLLTEALLLSLTGAALGVLLAYKLVAVIVGLLPEFSFPHEAAITINLPVLLFCVAVSLITGILFGLSPALRLSRPDVRDAMQSGSRSVAGKASGRALHNTLIAGQIALTLLLLSAAGEAIQGFLKLAHMRLGYDPHNVMSVFIPIRAANYNNIAARAAYVEQLRDKIAGVRGVQVAAISANATPPDNGFEIPVKILGQPAEDRVVRANLVSEGYFPLLRIPLREGRLWTPDENHNAAKLAVINWAFAKRYFPRGDALGHSISFAALTARPPEVVTVPGADGWLQIIGVVEDKLDQGLSKPILPEAFMPHTLGMGPGTQVLVRTDGPPLALLHNIGVQVATVDHDQQISGDIRDLEHWISREPEYARGQLISWLFGAFAVLALMLAAVGLYSLVSYTVVRRTNEFGIRMALGAMRSHVLGLVFRSTVVSVVSGVVAGSICALLLHRVMIHLTSPGAQSFAALLPAIGLLALVAVIASGIPALRAANIEPMTAVRYQ